MMRLLAVFVLLAGCAPQVVYDRSGATEAERAADAEACRRSNSVPRVSRPFVFSGGRIVSYPFEGVDRRGYDLCMEGKGYTVTRN
jgi:hypothetical protein